MSDHCLGGDASAPPPSDTVRYNEKSALIIHQERIFILFAAITLIAQAGRHQVCMHRIRIFPGARGHV